MFVLVFESESQVPSSQKHGVPFLERQREFGKNSIEIQAFKRDSLYIPSIFRGL